MKCIISIIALCISVSLCAIEEIIFPFMLTQPSSITRSMGLGYIGVADVWHQSPLIAWENPAMPALHDGIAIGYTNDRVQPYIDDFDIYFNSSMFTIGYYGIGLTLPCYNASGEFGTNIEYEMQPSYDYFQDGYDRAECYGISFNPLKYNRALTTQTNFLHDMDIAIGINYNELNSKWYLVPGCKDYQYFSKISTHSIDVGLLADKRIVLNEMFNLEASLGYKKFNIEDIHVKFDNGNNDPIGRNDIWGAGLSFSSPTNAMNQDSFLRRNCNYLLTGKKPTLQERDFISRYCDNFFTGRLMASRNISNNIDEVTSVGAELGLLDTIYLRGGYYNDELNEESGFTRGFGIRLHYKDLLTLEGNFAKYPLYHEFEDEQSWDFMLSFDAMKMLEQYVF